MLKRRDGYLLAVLPASRQLRLDAVGLAVGQPIGLATEDEIAELFPDCEVGAVPPVAAAYDMQCVVDDSIEGQRDVYFEAGDHRTLVHVSGDQFHRLMQQVPHGRFAREKGAPSWETAPRGHEVDPRAPS